MSLGKKTLQILAFAAVVALAMVLYYTFWSPLFISAEDAKIALANREFPIILDVRTDMEYKLGHYPEAVHIPIGQLADKAKEELPDKTKGILVYCNTGQRSRQAADILKAKGYQNVRYISGPYWSLLR